MSTLLGFHKQILKEIHEPAHNDLLILARGLGLRRIICTLLKIYDSPKNLVLIVNANSEEEAEVGEELGMMGCRKPGLRVIGYETGNKERKALYHGGGLIAVTSRILVVDMLKGDIPVNLITGMLVFHAEKVTALALEAFIVRLYREKNQNGFLKAFTDQPEHITSGMSPLKNIMKELQVRRAHMYPRFHEEVKKSLERRRADVVELTQDMTQEMKDIHTAIIQCINGTLAELKKSNTSLDLDDFIIENAYFRSFEIMVRKQLDSIWYKVGPKTKQLVNDLGTLRQLLYYLFAYDALQFHAYLETLVAANNVSAGGGTKIHHPPWMMTDAADIIIRLAKRRCYLLTQANADLTLPSNTIDLTAEDEVAWDVLDEIQGAPAKPSKPQRPWWLPQGLDPTLEELPKWSLLAEVLNEIEGEIIKSENMRTPKIGTDVVLVMTSSIRTCNTLSDFLSSMDPSAPKGEQGRKMMMRKLKTYLWWKSKLAEEESKPTGKTASSKATNKILDKEISEALKKKDRERAESAMSRRRVRGGAHASSTNNRGDTKRIHRDTGDLMMDEIREEANTIADFWASQRPPTSSSLTKNIQSGSTQVTNTKQQDFPEDDEDLVILDQNNLPAADDFDINYGLLEPQETVVIRAYSNDADDRMLAELQPRFIVMYEPCMEFARRVEVYRSSNPGLGVRIYHMVYGDSCEEHKYLAGIRKEKTSFERLIRERGSMMLTIEDRHAAGTFEIIKTISSRFAGGRKELNVLPSQVIVDMREFRSTLPSLLHAAGLLVIPATLTVGDYIITPEICVERKSLPDLVSSFNSGRLYAQCEVMSAHYKTPVLLIEFEEDKAFNLEIISELKSYVKPTSKYPPKRGGAPGGPSSLASTTWIPTIQSKLVLLLLTLPRVRIIWSSSPYATAEIFNDLKHNQPEPDPAKAVSIGAEEDPDAGTGINISAEELLRCLPGINAKNVKNVMNKVESVKELCELELEKVQEILGMEPGKECWEFMHAGEKDFEVRKG